MVLICCIVILISLVVIIKYISYPNEISDIATNKADVQNKYTTFDLKVAGVTFDNEDGTNRQALIKQLHIDDELILEPYTYQNSDAIYVKNLDLNILGNIPKNAVTNIKKYIDKGLILKVSVHSIGTFINELQEEIYYLKICIYINANDLSKIL